MMKVSLKISAKTNFVKLSRLTDYYDEICIAHNFKQTRESMAVRGAGVVYCKKGHGKLYKN